MGLVESPRHMFDCACMLGPSGGHLRIVDRVSAFCHSKLIDIATPSPVSSTATLNQPRGSFLVAVATQLKQTQVKPRIALRPHYNRVRYTRVTHAFGLTMRAHPALCGVLLCIKSNKNPMQDLYLSEQRNSPKQSPRQLVTTYAKKHLINNKSWSENTTLRI